MKLKPTQIVGLIAIVVFGGGMVFRMTQPSEREIMEQRLAALPRVEIPAPEFPMPDLSSINTTVTPPTSVLGSGTTPAPAVPETDYTVLGSQDARDDLYCAGVLSAEFDVKIKTDHPDKVVPLIEMQKSLDSAGIKKLRAEGNRTPYYIFSTRSAAARADETKALGGNGTTSNAADLLRLLTDQLG